MNTLHQGNRRDTWKRETASGCLCVKDHRIICAFEIISAPKAYMENVLSHSSSYSFYFILCNGEQTVAQTFSHCSGTFNGNTFPANSGDAQHNYTLNLVLLVHVPRVIKKELKIVNWSNTMPLAGMAHQFSS